MKKLINTNTSLKVDCKIYPEENKTFSEQLNAPINQNNLRVTIQLDYQAIGNFPELDGLSETQMAEWFFEKLSLGLEDITIIK